MKLFLLLFSLLLLPWARAQETSERSLEVVNHLNDEIPVYNFEEFEPLLYTETDKVYVVNFWAMWCLPCVRELPILEEYQRNHPEVEVILVSMDFPEDIDSKLKPFLKKRDIRSKVVLLDDPDANSWIDKVNPEWSGAIPYTIIFNKQNRTYHERAFESMEDLENVIINTLKTQ